MFCTSYSSPKARHLEQRPDVSLTFWWDHVGRQVRVLGVAGRISPTELLEKVVALVPRPRINLLVYHGVFAPHARARPPTAAAVNAGTAQCPTSPAERSSDGAMPSAPMSSERRSSPTRMTPSEHAARPPPGEGRGRHRSWQWAELLERRFALDVLACPGCGGRLRLLATIAPRYGLRPIRGRRLEVSDYPE